MELVITEKPSVARSIAKALGVADNSKDHKGYIEGGGYIISWCVGHLVELAPPERYSDSLKRWEIETLPIVPNPFMYEIKKDTKAQFKILKALMERADVTGLIAATDAGREGELIFRLVYEKVGCKKPFKRLWISSMEESAIRDGFTNLYPGNAFDSLYESALCRQNADWLVGINGTRLFTCLYNKLLKIGRVQTPTLSMIVERDMEIELFKSKPYYVLHLISDGLDAVSEKFTKKEDAEKAFNLCKGKSAKVVKVETKEKRVSPPKLYDLTSLQRDANRIFGLSAKETLNCTQSLYEKRLETYPRTDSKFITSDMEEKTFVLARDLHKAYLGTDYEPNIKAVSDSSKVTDHHAIIPTIEAKGKGDLSPNEEKVLSLIITRLFAATSSSYIYKATKVLIDACGIEFKVTGSVLVSEGFKEYERFLREKYKSKDKAPKEAVLPKLEEGWVINPKEIKVAEEFTKPPLFFTEETLLKAMEHAGCDEMEDEVERKGLGTPATRADIIEKLVKDGFIKREKKNLISTLEGRKLITIAPERIRSPKLTAEWENALLLVSKNEYGKDQFMKGIKTMVEEMVGTYKEVTENPFENEREVIGTCPKCGSDVFYGNYGAYCKESCGMFLSKGFGHVFTKDEIKSLLSGKKTLVCGLISKKSGKTYSANLTVNDIKEFSYMSNDGQEKLGYALGFSMDFESKK